MKKNIIALFLAFFCTFNCYAQSGWFWQNPTPTGNDINRMKFINNNFGFAVGNYGTVIKTYNGGANWINVSTGSKYQLNGMYFLNFNTGFVVGKNSTIYKTTNGGFNWINYSIAETANFESIVMFGQTTGVAVASGIAVSSVYRTTNSGVNWIKSTFPGPSYENREISLLDSTSALLFGYNSTAGGGYILKTSDKGANWNQVYADDSLDFFSADVIDSQTIIAMARSLDYFCVVKTTNAGVSWSVQLVESFDNFGTTMKKIAFINSLTGYCAGSRNILPANKSRVFKTTDGGITWGYTQLQDSLINLMAVDVIGTNRVIVGGQGGYLARSTNSGSTFSRAFRTITTQSINDVSFINPNTGIVVCSAGEIYKTVNAGNSWQRQFIDSAFDITCCKLINENTGYLASSKRIYKTTNGGTTWIKVLMVNAANWNDMDVPTTDVCRVVGNSCPNTSVYTTNGGVSWEDVSAALSCSNGPPTMEVTWYTGISMPSPNLLCIIGGTTYPHAGSVPKAWLQRDGGFLNQIFMGGLQTPGMKSVDFYDTLNGFISGNYKLRMRTTDGGLNWVDYGINLQNGTALGLVRFASPNILFAEGGSLKSTNGGANWFDVTFITEQINNTDFITQEVGVSVGSFGKIVRTNIGGVLATGENNGTIPTDFVLQQNYPNPFNPVTKIRFSVPPGGNSSASKLIVYDVLGRVVRTLVNEVITPGNHEIDFEASALPSGVYFYKFTSGDFSDTKKMVLLK